MKTLKKIKVFLFLIIAILTIILIISGCSNSLLSDKENQVNSNTAPNPDTNNNETIKSINPFESPTLKLEFENCFGAIPNYYTGNPSPVSYPYIATASNYHVATFGSYNGDQMQAAWNVASPIQNGVMTIQYFYDTGYQPAPNQPYIYDTTFNVYLDGELKGTLSPQGCSGSPRWDYYKKVILGPVSVGQHTIKFMANVLYTGSYVKLDAFYIREAIPIDTTIQAEKFYGGSGITEITSPVPCINSTTNNGTAYYLDVNFGAGNLNQFTVNVSNNYTGTITIKALNNGSTTIGTIIGSLYVTNTGGAWQEQSCYIIPITGVHDVLLTFNGTSGVGNIDWFKFNVNGLDSADLAFNGIISTNTQLNALNHLSATDTTVTNNAYLVFRANVDGLGPYADNYIKLKSGFVVNAGCKFSAFIGR